MSITAEQALLIAMAAGVSAPLSGAAANPATRPSISVAVDTILDISHTVVYVDCTSGPVTITLPPAASVIYHEFDIHKTDDSGNALTIIGTDSETINGETSQEVVSQNDSVTAHSDGTEYRVL